MAEQKKAPAKKTATKSAAKKPTTRKKPAAKKPAPPPVTALDLHSAQSVADLAQEQVKYFERRLHSARAHDTISIKQILVAKAEANLAAAKADFLKAADEYQKVKAELYKGSYNRGW